MGTFCEKKRVNFLQSAGETISFKERLLTRFQDLTGGEDDHEEVNGFSIKAPVHERVVPGEEEESVGQGHGGAGETLPCKSERERANGGVTMRCIRIALHIGEYGKKEKRVDEWTMQATYI